MYEMIEMRFENAYGVSLAGEIKISPLTRRQALEIVRELNSSLPCLPQMRGSVSSDAEPKGVTGTAKACRSPRRRGNPAGNDHRAEPRGKGGAADAKPAGHPG